MSAERQARSVELMRIGIEVQKKGILSRKRYGDLHEEGFFLLPAPAHSPRPLQATVDCDPLPADQVDHLVDNASRESALPAGLIWSVMKVESGFRPCAVSNKGASGLMQLMQETAVDLGVSNIFDPQQNVNGAARYLGQLMGLYNGDVGLALSAYNAGPGRVLESGGVPQIPETLDYVRKILDLTTALKKSSVEHLPLSE
jgi:hypothetical protein